MRTPWRLCRCCWRTAPIPTAADHAGHSALWLAAVRNDVAVVKALLSAGVSPDAHAAGEQTPLLAALRATHSDAAQMLLAAGANPEATDAQGRTPLMLACAGGQSGARADPARAPCPNRYSRITRKRTALWYAAAAGSRDEVDALLAAGANPKEADALGLSVLHAAAAQQDAAVLERLLGADPPINQRSTGGDTALLIAASLGHAEVVKALLARSPDLECSEQRRRHGVDRGQPRRLHRRLPSAAGGGSQQGAAQRRRRLGGRCCRRAGIRGDRQGNCRQAANALERAFSRRSTGPCRCRPLSARSRYRSCGRRRTACPR